MFRILDQAGAAESRKWARDNYRLGTAVSDQWHPVVRAECEAMNAESFVEDAAPGPLVREFWGCIRRNESGEFLLPDDCGTCHQIATMRADATDQNIPDWARANRVVRVVKVSVREV